MKRYVVILSLLFVPVRIFAVLHLAYYQGYPYYPPEDKLATLIRQKALNTYGKDKMFDYHIKYGIDRPISIYFGDNNTMVIHYCENYEQPNKDMVIELIYLVKSVIDSLSEIDSTIYSLFPSRSVSLGFKNILHDISEPEIQDRLLQELRKNSQIITEERDNKNEYHIVFGKSKDGLITVSESFRVTLTISPIIRGQFRIDYEEECKKRGIRNITVYNIAQTNFNNEEKNLLLKYMKLYDEFIITNTPIVKIYPISISYNLGND